MKIENGVTFPDEKEEVNQTPLFDYNNRLNTCM
jgi:hypothetical protein